MPLEHHSFGRIPAFEHDGFRKWIRFVASLESNGQRSMVMLISSDALDMIATDLSAFTNPDIPELALRDDKTLQNNMLASIIGAFGGATNAPVRHQMTNIVRRVFASIETYRRGRAHALDYVQGDRHSRIIPYFHALTDFECCASYSWQVADLLRGMTSKDVYPRGGDGSAWHRLHDIYTEGIKHSFDKYDSVAHGEAPTTVWLTDEGIACISGHTLKFRELAEIIEANNGLFYDVQTKAIQKRRNARAQTQCPDAEEK